MLRRDASYIQLSPGSLQVEVTTGALRRVQFIQKKGNREKRKILRWGVRSVRSIGLERVRANLGLRNLAYNLKRYVYLETRAAQAE